MLPIFLGEICFFAISQFGNLGEMLPFVSERKCARVQICHVEKGEVLFVFLVKFLFPFDFSICRQANKCLSIFSLFV